MYFSFLSNFSPHGFIDVRGIRWRTSEHFYQATKTDNFKHKRIIAECDTPGKAKRAGQKVDLVEDWNKKKISVMYRALKMKFGQNLGIRKKLISTFEYKLIEGNYWHDNFWGNCFCDKCKKIEGRNYLGNVLMIIRDGYAK